MTERIRKIADLRVMLIGIYDLPVEKNLDPSP